MREIEADPSQLLPSIDSDPAGRLLPWKGKRGLAKRESDAASSVGMRRPTNIPCGRVVLVSGGCFRTFIRPYPRDRSTQAAGPHRLSSEAVDDVEWIAIGQCDSAPDSDREAPSRGREQAYPPASDRTAVLRRAGPLGPVPTSADG